MVIKEKEAEIIVDLKEYIIDSELDAYLSITEGTRTNNEMLVIHAAWKLSMCHALNRILNGESYKKEKDMIKERDRGSEVL